MLKKAAVDEGKDWEKLLPYLLFTYREVPQDSTGFSPFELLYGRAVRGPLDVLRESWEASSRNNESGVSLVLSVREKMANMTELVQRNLAKAQRQQTRMTRMQNNEVSSLGNKSLCFCQHPQTSYWHSSRAPTLLFVAWVKSITSSICMT